MSEPPHAHAAPLVTLVAPALNEAGNLTPLLDQVDAAFRAAGIPYLSIIVDDGSTDGSPGELAELKQRMPQLTVIRHETPRGQSAAMRAGMHAATTPLIALLDADLQNDPADLPRMVLMQQQTGADLVQGDRSHNRRDNAARRYASVVGRMARRYIVGDTTRDTGCGTRILRADYARRLPLHKKGMHRFIPACVAGFGGKVVETPVNHHPRTIGKTKYGAGFLKRGLPGLRDCFAVRGMIREAQQAPPPPASSNASSAPATPPP